MLLPYPPHVILCLLSERYSDAMASLLTRALVLFDAAGDEAGREVGFSFAMLTLVQSFVRFVMHFFPLGCGASAPLRRHGSRR